MKLGEAFKIIKRNKGSFAFVLLLAVTGAVFSAISIIAGVIIIVLDVIYAFTSTGKVEEDVKLTKSDIKEAKEELNKTKDEIKDYLKEIEKMKKEIFDVFSHDSFTPIEKRMEKIEEELGVGHGGFGHSFRSMKTNIEKIEDRIKRVEDFIDDFKRGLRRF